MSAADSTSTSGDLFAAMVALPPPPRMIQEQVTRLLVELLARRALVELGVLPSNENQSPE